jgi:hypothetical protein
VDDPKRLGEISWESPAPRVNVGIESQLVLYPDSAEWMAVLRYDVCGGALDAIHLRMPAAWSEQAVIRLTDAEYRVSKDVLGPNAFWTIAPTKPIWGSARLSLRSSLPVSTDREMVYPELAPLGWGAVDGYVGVMNASGRPVSIAKSSGLQSIPYSSRFRSKDFTVGVGTQLAAFRVMSKEWTLQIQMARNETPAEKLEQARVALADISVSVAADGSATGRADYDLSGGGGSSLSFELPSNGTLLGVTIDSAPIQPVKDSARRWSILLGNRRPSRVCVIWRTAAAAPAGDQHFSVALPRAGIGQSPARVAVRIAPGTIIDGELGALQPVAPYRFELARADRLGRAISDLVGTIDRSSGRDHEKLISLLINHEMALRDAERSIRWSDPAERERPTSRLDREKSLIESARRDRTEILRRAGLEDDLASAQSYLGLSVKGAERLLIGVVELDASDRIRSSGDCTTFVGVVPGVDAPANQRQLTIESPSRDGVWQYPRIRGLILVFAFLAMSLLTLIVRRRPWIEALAVISALALAGYWGGPVVLAGGLGLAAVAWLTGR